MSSWDNWKRPLGLGWMTHTRNSCIMEIGCFILTSGMVIPETPHDWKSVRLWNPASYDWPRVATCSPIRSVVQPTHVCCTKAWHTRFRHFICRLPWIRGGVHAIAFTARLCQGADGILQDMSLTEEGHGTLSGGRRGVSTCVFQRFVSFYAFITCTKYMCNMHALYWY